MSDSSDNSAGVIRIGPAGWSYKDWEGTVYPPHRAKFDHLEYLSRFFSTIEVNSSFYRVPPVAHGQSWVKRVSARPDFRFTVKLFRGFTHEGKASPADLTAFCRFLDAIADEGRLGAVLIQYPWSYRRVAEHERQIRALLESFRDYPKVLEVRHSSFDHPDFYRLLEDEATGLANIDQPLFSDSIKPSEIVTAQPGYVRLHGRNYEKWFTHKESWERYDYLYSRDELRPWAERAERMARGGDVYVVTNNHFRGQAIVNAIELKQSMGMETLVPDALAMTYPGRFEKES